MTAPIFDAFREAADADGRLSYADFSRIALYHPVHGYYRRERERVGRSAETDFYTAASLGDVFAELLLGAINKLLPSPTKNYTLVELGVERGRGTLAQAAESFGGYAEIGVDQAMELPEQAVVFANELLDAQPFHRFGYSDGQWREYGVQVGAESLEEITLPEPSAAGAVFLADLPESSEGYRLDISLEAEQLLARIAGQVRDGLMVFFDYGKSWPIVLEGSPAGSARGYYHHEITSDLLERPGEQDLTCHVCWDRLASVLEATGWPGAKLQSQETFFVSHATQQIEGIIADPAFTTRKQTLKELIYPGHMGRKFQALYATRS